MWAGSLAAPLQTTKRTAHKFRTGRSAASRDAQGKARAVRELASVHWTRSPMAPATVLVVDDDRANLESVARIFQHEG